MTGKDRRRGFGRTRLPLEGSRRGETTFAADAEGFTLIEVVITIFLVGTGVVAVLAALQVAVTAAVVQQHLAQAEVSLRAAVEYVRLEPFEACAGPGDYGSGFTPRQGTSLTVVSVEHWNGTLASNRPYSGSCAQAGWPQLITLRVDLVGGPIDGSVATEFVKRDR